MTDFAKGKENGSQSNEDEIIARIFSSIGEGTRRFVEFGCGDGRQNNTIALLLRGWSGIWIEKRRRSCQSAIVRWGGYPVHILRRNMNPKAADKLIPHALDFLSIDIDGGDYAVWQGITRTPRVVCIEYAPQPPGKSSAPPIPLAEFVSLAHDKGYFLWGTSASEVNAFFVRANEGKHE